VSNRRTGDTGRMEELLPSRPSAAVVSNRCTGDTGRMEELLPSRPSAAVVSNRRTGDTGRMEEFDKKGAMQWKLNVYMNCM